MIPPIKTKKIVGLLGFGLLIISAFLFNESTAFPGKNAALPVLGMVLLDMCSEVPVGASAINTMDKKFHLAIGRVGCLLHHLEKEAIGATILLADLTHRYIEEPFRNKKFAPTIVYRKTAYVTGISVFMGLLIMFSNNDKIDVSGVNGSISLAQIKARPQVYDDGCHANYSQTQSAKCEYANLDSEKVMVLYGDSHAAQWFPALLEIANRSGYKLISLTKSACPAVDTKRNDQGGFKMAKCAKWRENTTKRIREIQPDVLVMSSFQYFAQPKQFTDRQAWWNEGQQKLMRAVKTASPHLIYITDTPHPTRDIPACLTNNPISKCNTSERSKDLSIPGFDVIDPNPWLCSNVCPAVKDGVVAYRDASHISVDMSITFSESRLAYSHLAD